MFRSTLIVSILAVLGSGVSFLNQLVLARFFGAGTEMSAYLLAISLPLTLGGLIGGVLGYQLVPALQRAEVQAGTCEPLLRSFAQGLGAATLALATLGALISGRLIQALNPHLPAAQAALAADIARVAWLWLPLVVLVTIYSAGLHVRQKFALATLLQSAPIIGALVFCLAGHRQFGVAVVAWGQLAGYVAMAAGLRAMLGPMHQPGHNWQEVRRLCRDLPLTLAALLIFVIYPFSDAFWGSRVGTSAISYLGYAQRLLVGLSGIAVVGATTVLFPRMARHAAEGDHHSLRGNLAISLRIMLACMAPAAGLFGVLVLPTLQVLFQRGAFELADARSLARLLPPMLVGMAAMSCMGLVFKALFARGEVRVAAAVSVAGTVVYFTLSGLLGTTFGLVGIGVAYALSWWLVLGLSLQHLWHGEMGTTTIRANFQFALRLAMGAALTVGIGWVGAQFLPSENSTDNFRRLLVLASTGFSAAAAYVVIGNGPLALPEVRLLTQQLFALAKRP